MPVAVAISLHDDLLCGGCRQKIYEFSIEGCEIVSVGANGEVGRRTIEQLLPLAFRLEPGEGRGA